MNVVRFRLAREEVGMDSAITVTPYIDGISLVDLARRVELDPARRQGEADLAGDYAGLVAERPGWQRWYRNSREQSSFHKDGDALLGCTCGTTECWSLLADVAIDSATVTWRHFRTAFRSWDLSDLGPFTFDHGQYDHALEHPDHHQDRDTNHADV